MEMVAIFFRDNGINLGVSSLQCGRRVDSLKWFLDWKFYTKQRFSDRVENYHQLAKFSEDFINASVDLEMVLKRTSFNVYFRFKTNHLDNNNFNQRLRDRLYQEQHALLSLAYVEKKLVFRLLISNIYMNKMKLISLLNRLIKTGKSLNDV